MPLEVPLAPLPSGGMRERIADAALAAITAITSNANLAD